ncbi:hypothetical protein KAU39_08045 [bacterium]|jgi:hypothetical protein|nr:hypothetical protein [bacterium]
MEKLTLAVKLNADIIKRVKKFCIEHGTKYGFFVEKALKAQLEQEEIKEDLLDLKTLHEQEKLAIPFEEYLKDRHV